MRSARLLCSAYACWASECSALAGRDYPQAQRDLQHRLPPSELTATLNEPRNLGVALDLIGVYLKNYEIDNLQIRVKVSLAMGYGEQTGAMPSLATAEKADDDMVAEKILLSDGTSVKMFRSPKMSEEQWQQTKTYLQGNPADTKKLVEHSTNPDKIRKQKMMRAMADVWQDQIDGSNEDFARRMKELEQEPEFEALFASIKDYQVQQIRSYVEDKELMQKISKKMGGVRASQQ
eukprot:Skav208453  [mRNA]  locus=scaffold1104:71256:84736:+ [translate_table: standard]